jgi:hypothetical protein
MIDTCEPKREGEYGCVPIRRNYSLVIPSRVSEKIKNGCGFVTAESILAMGYENLAKRYYSTSFIGSLGNFWIFVSPILEVSLQIVIHDSISDSGKRFDDQAIDICTFLVSDVIDT